MASEGDSEGASGPDWPWDEPEDLDGEVRPLWIPETYVDGWPSSYQAWSYGVDRLLLLLRQRLASSGASTTHITKAAGQLGGVFAAIHRLVCSFLAGRGSQGLVEYMDSRMDTQSQANIVEPLESQARSDDWQSVQREVSGLLSHATALLSRLSHIPSVATVQHDLLSLMRVSDVTPSSEANSGRRSIANRETDWVSLTTDQKADLVRRVVIEIGLGSSERKACKSVGIAVNTFRDHVKRDRKLKDLYDGEMSKRRAKHGPRREDSYVDPDPDLD